MALLPSKQTSVAPRRVVSPPTTDHSERRREVVAGLDLPSPPATLLRILQAAALPTTGLHELSPLVAQDPAFVVELLRVANSPLFRQGSSVLSADRALAVLGLVAVRNVALCSAIRRSVDPKDVGAFDLGRFWEDSVRRAVSAQLLASRATTVDPLDAFTASLLQDIGVLALVRSHPDRAERWMALVDEPADVRRNAEERLFGVSHDRLGSRLAEAWHLPPELSAPLSFHHDPQAAPRELRDRCKLAFGAELLASPFSCHDKAQAIADARTVLASELGLAPEVIDLLWTELGPRVQEIAAVLGIRVPVQPSFEELLAEATSGLASFALNQHELAARHHEVCRERDELKRELELRMASLAALETTDTATGLRNRRGFFEWLSGEVDRIRTLPESLVVMAIDVLPYDAIADRSGHDLAERVLRRVVRSLEKVLRRGDVLARVGGGQLALALPKCEGDEAMRIASKLAHLGNVEVALPPVGEAAEVVVRLELVMGLVVKTGPSSKAESEATDPVTEAGRLFEHARLQLKRQRDTREA